MTTLLEKYTKLASDFNSLKEEMETMKASVAAKDEQLANKSVVDGVTKEEYEATKKSVTDLTAQVETLTAGNTNLVKERDEALSKLTDFEAKASEKALLIAQEQGIPQTGCAGTQAGSDPSSSPIDMDVVAKFESIKDPVKAREFWMKNKQAILASTKRN